MPKKAATSAKPASRDQNLSLRVTPAIRAAFLRAAHDDKRTLSALAEIVLEGWLKEKGYLK